MKSYLKCLFLILSFAIILDIVAANDKEMINSFMKQYPNNMGYDEMFSISSKLCICGLNTENVGSLGNHLEMYKLAQANFVWSEAEEKAKKTLWNNASVNSGYLGSGMWYSPGDSSFAAYTIPAAQMKSVLEGWSEIISKVGITATVEACKVNLAYLAPNWFDLVKKDRGTKELREAFAEEHGMKEHYWELWLKNKFTMAYPESFEGATMTWADDKKMKTTKLTREIVMKMPRNNSIVCPITVTNKKGKVTAANMVYMDINAKYKLFYHVSKPLEFKNGFEAAGKLWGFSSHVKEIGTPSMSNRAFMFAHDIDTIALDNRDEVIDKLVLPNTFEYSICVDLLKTTSIGGIYGVDGSKDWPVIFDFYKMNCPMITWKGPMTYAIPDKNSPGGKKYLVRPTMFDKDKDHLFPEVADDMEPRDDIYKMLDIIIDGTQVEFKKNEKYDETLEAATNGVLDAEKADEEKEEEKSKHSPKDPSPISEKQGPTQQEIEQAIADMKKKLEGHDSEEGEGEGEGEGEEEEETSFVASSKSGVSETVELEMPVIIKIRTCEERRVEIEEMLQDQEPKTITMAATMINLMMQHPHLIDCKEMIKYEFSFNDDGGTVLNINPEGVVMHWKVRKVNPFKYDPQQKDPGKIVYEVIFYNHDYEEQKDALYYIPAREVVNEWDKFPYILDDFFNFAETRMGDILDVVAAYDKMKQYVQSQMLLVSISKGWVIEDTDTGPKDLPGNSTSTQFANKFSNPNANYIIRFFKLEEPNRRGFYDFVFQSWRIGEKYIMVKINGTQFNYSVLINIYSNEEKLNTIWNGLFNKFEDQFFDESAVVSLLEIKHMVYYYMENKAHKYKIGFEPNVIPIDQDEYDEPKKGHDYMMTNDYTAFMFTFEAFKVDKSVNVRGFVHYRENISVLNLFFSTDMFQSEYIIPLSDAASFSTYIDDIFEECYIHMHMLLQQINIVEDEDTTEAVLDEEQKLGRYSMKKLLFKLIELLSTKAVYGCIASFEIPATEQSYDDNGVVIPAEDLEAMDDGDANKRQYKWTVEQEDSTGEFLMLRSNFRFMDVKSSRCDSDELMNPTLIHLYSTRLDDRNGYALTINSPSLDMDKDIKTTYHFVKYQDYAHMRVFEQFIGKILNQMFDPAPTASADEEKTEE